LAFAFRVGAINGNPVFPPTIRMNALRTFLPETLPAQVRAWKVWCEEVAGGVHVDFLRRLWAYETTMSLNHFGSELQRVASLSLEETAKWTRRPELTAVRNKILASSVSEVLPAPIYIPNVENTVQPMVESDEMLSSIWKAVRALVQLTRAWDSKVKGRWKLQYYEDYYESFEQFLAHAKSDRLGEFFDWADQCCSERMGLFLDY
jgi:hypothetical protein